LKKKTEKTEPNRIKNRAKPEKKPSQTKKTEPNQFERVFVLKNRIETNRFELVSVFFKKNQFNYYFFIKTEPNKK
jgi:hypothetical protein